MTTEQIIQALRCCALTTASLDCCPLCPLYQSTDLDACIPAMETVAADALANAQTHITALQRGLDDLRKQLEEVKHEQQKRPDCP